MPAVYSALFASALGALVWLHWQRRGTRPPEWLPTAAFVPEMSVSQGAARQLVRRPLFVLRVALLGALAWASVRAASSLLPPPAAGDAAVVLVLDASGSMAQRHNSTTAWSLARDRLVREVARAKERGEAVGLFVAKSGSAAADVPFTHEYAAIEAALGALSPGGGAALTAAIERAHEAGARHGHVARGLLVTDGAAHAWPEGHGLLSRAPFSWAIESVVAPGAQNDSVDAVHTEVTSDDALLVRLELTRHGGASGSRRVRLEVEGDVLERLSVPLMPDRAASVSARVAFRPKARASRESVLVRAQLEPDSHDALVADDVRATWVTPRSHAAMTALTDHARRTEDPATYVAHALSHPMQGGGAIDVQVAASPAAAAASEAPLLLVADVGLGAQDAPDTVRDALLSGANKAVLQSLGDAAAAPAMGAAPPPLVFGQLRDARAPSEAPARGRRLGDTPWRHPLLSGIDPLVKASLREARVYRYWQVTDLPREAEVVLPLDDGSPLLVALPATRSSHRRLLWTSTLTPQWTDLPLRSGFVPLMHRMAAWLLGGEPHQPASVTRGLPFAVRAAGDAAASIRWKSVSGAEKRIAGGAREASQTVSLEEEGLWQAERLVEGRWQRWVDFDVWVDAPLLESDLRGAEAVTGGASARASTAGDARPGEGEDYRWLLAVALLLSLDALASPMSSPKKAARVGVVPRD